MKDPKIKKYITGRREFISKLSAAAAIGLIGPNRIKGSAGADRTFDYTQPETEMPMINLGPYRISRLICGSNPIRGGSYLGNHSDRQMREYFTPERTVEFLMECEQAGITAHQMTSRLDYIQLLRDKGSKMNVFILHSDREKIKETIDIAHPLGFVHHGGVTDSAFEAGNLNLVHDYVKTVKDYGLLAGVSAHNPDAIKQIADEDWEVDFFMTSFYNLTRKVEKEEHLQILPVGNYHFFKDDPKIMTQVIRQVKQPCLAFKILAAGRLCSNQDIVRSAFKFAFENIKPTDGVIVGMFPWFFDEIGANAGYTRELG